MLKEVYQLHICINQIAEKIIFNMKTEYYFELLTTESAKLLGKANIC